MANVILLNGCSSAGKTTLALKLQQLLSEPYQHVALDQFRDGMPGRLEALTLLRATQEREDSMWCLSFVMETG